MMEDVSVALGMQALSLILAENEEDGILGQRRWKFAQNAQAHGATSLSMEVYRRFLQQLKQKAKQPSEEMISWAKVHGESDLQGGPQSLNELALMKLSTWMSSVEDCAMSVEWVKHAGRVELKGEGRVRKMAKLSNGRDIEFLVKTVELNLSSGQSTWFQCLVVQDSDVNSALGTPFRSVRPLMMVSKEPESALFGSREKMVVGYVDQSKDLALAYCADGASVKLSGDGGPWKKGDVLEGVVVVDKPSRKKSEEYSRHMLEQHGFPPRAICHLECHSPQSSTDAFDAFKTVEMLLVEKGNRWTAISKSGYRHSLEGIVKKDVNAPLGSLVIAQAMEVHRIDRKKNKLTARLEVFEVVIDAERQGPGLREFEGRPDWTTDRKGNPVGFLNEYSESCFIPPYIAKKPDAQSASQWLAHKGDRGWVAFYFLVK